MTPTKTIECAREILAKLTYEYPSSVATNTIEEMSVEKRSVVTKLLQA